MSITRFCLNSMTVYLAQWPRLAEAKNDITRTLTEPLKHLLLTIILLYQNHWLQECSDMAVESRRWNRCQSQACSHSMKFRKWGTWEIESSWKMKISCRNVVDHWLTVPFACESHSYCKSVWQKDCNCGDKWTLTNNFSEADCTQPLASCFFIWWKSSTAQPHNSYRLHCDYFLKIFHFISHNFGLFNMLKKFTVRLFLE